MYYVGLDLGQRSDYTALAVLEAPVFARQEIWTVDEQNRAGPQRAGWMSPAAIPPGAWGDVRIANAEDRQTYALRHLQRFALGTPYPEIVTAVRDLMQRAPLQGRAALLVDATGVGRPVVDALKAAGMEPYAVTITGGDAVVRDGHELRAPKRDLAMCVQVLLQERRLVFAAGLPLLDVLKRELQSFEVKINPQTAHDSYLAWREGQHDDLVLAVAMAAWAATADPPVVYGPWSTFQMPAYSHSLRTW